MFWRKNGVAAALCKGRRLVADTLLFFLPPWIYQQGFDVSDLYSLQKYLAEHGFDVSADLLTPNTDKCIRFPHGVSRNGEPDKDSGWLYLHQYQRLNGDPFYVATFGSHRDKSRQYVYKSHQNLHWAEEKSIAVQATRRAQVSKNNTANKNAEAANKAAWIWQNSALYGETPYMTSRLMPELYGCRIYRSELLCVPLRDIDGELWSVQLIAPDRKKKFLYGSKQAGCFHVIGDTTTNRAYLSEGIATAASIFQATGVSTIVGFSANNLPKVAQALHDRYPTLAITVCGDDDRFGRDGNSGREYGEAAAQACGGKAVFPVFADDDNSGGTDFNDLHRAQGLDSVRRQVCGD